METQALDEKTNVRKKWPQKRPESLIFRKFFQKNLKKGVDSLKKVWYSVQARSSGWPKGRRERERTEP